MDAPGLSIFQGHTNIQIDDDEAQKLHEQEALKEQAERNHELGNQLMNAFDDLDESDNEDDVTADDSSAANLISRISETDVNGACNGLVTPNRYQYQNENGLAQTTDSDEQHGGDYIGAGGKRYQQHHPISNEYKLNNPDYQLNHHHAGGVAGVYGSIEEYGQGDTNSIEDEQKARYLEARAGSIEQLKVLYDVRVREVQTLATQLDESRAHSEHTISELRKQLTLCMAEKERAVKTRQHTQELLVEAKTELGDLHNKIDSLNSTIRCLEGDKDTMKNELLIAKASLQDSYQRLQMLDRGFGNDKHLEAIIKQSKERHQEEIRNYDTMLQSMKSRLENYETEVKLLETRNKDLHREQEKLLLEKAETINQLARKLEDTQKQYQALLETKTSVTSTEDVNRLHRDLDDVTRQNEALKRQLEDATNILETLAQETMSSCEEQHRQQQQQQINNPNHLNHHEEETMDSEAETDSMCDMNLIRRPKKLQNGDSKTTGSNGNSISDRLYRLQNELRRCIVVQKDRRNEIKMLRDALANKDAQIKTLQQNESAAIFQATHYRDEAQKLSGKLLQASDELHSRPDNSDLIVGLNREKTRLEQDLANARAQIQKLELKIQELEQLSDMKRKISAESTPYNSNNNNAMNHHHQLMNNSAAMKQLQSELDKIRYQLADSQKEVDRYKTMYIEISGSKELMSKELDELKRKDFVKDLHEAKENCNRLEKQLKDSEKSVAELTDKLRQSELRSVQSSPLSLSGSARDERCTEHLNTIQRLESECIRLRENCSLHRRDAVELNTKLMDAAEEIRQLKTNLELKKQRDCMIDDLKEKARQFEEFMLNHNTQQLQMQQQQSAKKPPTNDEHSTARSVATSPIKELLTDVVLVTKDEAQDESAAKKTHQAETKIRAELSELFAAEIRQLDEKYQSEKQNSEERFAKALAALKNQLVVRCKEVEVLKHAVITERAKFKESLDNQRLDEHGRDVRELLETQLDQCKEKIQSLTKDLEDRNMSMAAVIKEYANEFRTMANKLKENEKTVQHLTEKYTNAKKCVNNYKAYINDKETHFKKEVARIKDGYEQAVVKMQNKMEKIIQTGEQKAAERLKDIELHYQDKLDKVKSDSYKSSNVNSIKL